MSQRDVILRKAKTTYPIVPPRKCTQLEIDRFRRDMAFLAAFCNIYSERSPLRSQVRTRLNSCTQTAIQLGHDFLDPAYEHLLEEQEKQLETFLNARDYREAGIQTTPDPKSLAFTLSHDVVWFPDTD